MDISNEALEALRKQAEAHLEANRLEKERLEVERQAIEVRQRELSLQEREIELRRQAEIRRDGRLSEVIGRYANLGEQVTGLIEAKNVSDSILREGLEAFSAEIKIIKRGLYAMLSRDTDETKRARRALKSEFEREETQDLLIKQRRNLAKLKQREAGYGSLNVPLELQNQIEATEAEVLRLEDLLNNEPF